MAVLEWSDKLSAGSNLLDADHKKLLALVQKLREVSRDPSSGRKGGAVLGELIDAVRAHLTHEETLMRRTAYPRFIPHKIEHDRLVNHLEDFRKKLAAGQAGLNEEMIVFLQTWLCDHMSKIDGPLGEWLVKNDPQTA